MFYLLFHKIQIRRKECLQGWLSLNIHLSYSIVKSFGLEDKTNLGLCIISATCGFKLCDLNQ
jgi:hypothetical protein